MLQHAPAPIAAANADHAAAAVQRGLLLGNLPSAFAHSDELLRFGWQMLHTPHLSSALAMLRHTAFDAVVLHGSAALLAELQLLRPQVRGVLLVVTLAPDPFDEVLALEAGADSVMLGPLEPRRLRAHLMALRRRQQPPPHDGGQALDLPPVQQRLMQALQAAQGRTVPREHLCQLGWPGQPPKLHSRALDVCMARLRQRLKAMGLGHWRLRAERGWGYRLDQVQATVSAPVPSRSWSPALGHPLASAIAPEPRVPSPNGANLAPVTARA
jgi:DNA-binding response OmpR family regulator